MTSVSHYDPNKRRFTKKMYDTGVYKFRLVDTNFGWSFFQGTNKIHVDLNAHRNKWSKTSAKNDWQQGDKINWNEMPGMVTDFFLWPGYLR